MSHEFIQLLDVKYYKGASQVSAEVKNHYLELDFSFLDRGEDVVDPPAHGNR